MVAWFATWIARQEEKKRRGTSKVKQTNMYDRKAISWLVQWISRNELIGNRCISKQVDFYFSSLQNHVDCRLGTFQAWWLRGENQAPNHNTLFLPLLFCIAVSHFPNPAPTTCAEFAYVCCSVCESACLLLLLLLLLLSSYLTKAFLNGLKFRFTRPMQGTCATRSSVSFVVLFFLRLQDTRGVLLHDIGTHLFHLTNVTRQLIGRTFKIDCTVTMMTSRCCRTLSTIHHHEERSRRSRCHCGTHHCRCRQRREMYRRRYLFGPMAYQINHHCHVGKLRMYAGM